MKQVINGLVYNTDTADEICEVGSQGSIPQSNHEFWSATLYRTKKGRFFMEGVGGARSPFAKPYGQGGSQGGSGIRALSHDMALAYAEASGVGADEIARFFKVDEA